MHTHSATRYTIISREPVNEPKYFESIHIESRGKVVCKLGKKAKFAGSRKDTNRRIHTHGFWVSQSDKTSVQRWTYSARRDVRVEQDRRKEGRARERERKVRPSVRPRACMCARSRVCVFSTRFITELLTPLLREKEWRSEGERARERERERLAPSPTLRRGRARFLSASRRRSSCCSTISGAGTRLPTPFHFDLLLLSRALAARARFAWQSAEWVTARLYQQYTSLSLSLAMSSFLASSRERVSFSSSHLARNKSLNKFTLHAPGRERNWARPDERGNNFIPGILDFS